MSRLRRLGLGLATLTGAATRGWFIPYRHADAAKPAAYPALEPMFEAARPAFVAMLARIESCAGELTAFGGGEGAPRLDQEWFPRLDAAAAFALVRHERPARIVEVGSGHSTRFLARAAAAIGGAAITCVDPAPRASIAALGVRHLARVWSDEDTASAAAELQAGDVLFIDSSHVAMPGSDVDRLVLDLLPRLAPGVFVHIHDIFLPDAYPEAWEWRGYNEQLVVGALLQGGGYDLVFASHWTATRLAADVSAGVLSRLPLRPGVPETSLWLRKRG